jgi:serpin B
MYKTLSILLSLSVVSVLSLSACTHKKDDQIHAASTPAADTLLTQKKLFKAADATDTPYRLYGLLSENPTNLNFSPLSLNMAFAEVYLGSEGNSKGLLEQIFGFKEGAFSFEPELKIASGTEKTGAKLSIVNSVWVKKSQMKSVLFSYKQDLAKYLDGTVNPLELKKMNTWVSDVTHQQIKTLMTQLDPSVVSVFVNAIYLKADWLMPFKTDLTYLEAFRSSPHLVVKTQMMHQSGKFKYFENDLSRWISMPYQELPLEMLVGLPVKDGALKDVEQKLNVELVSAVMKGLKEETVDLTLPKFKFESHRSLKDTFVNAGYEELFHAANFARFSSNKELAISDVIQATAIQVDEKGTEAAAATAVATVERASISLGRKAFKADQPFIFLIRNTQTGAIYFMGRVLNPLE